MYIQATFNAQTKKPNMTKKSRQENHHIKRKKMMTNSAAHNKK